MQTNKEILQQIEHNHAYPPIVSDAMIYEAMDEAKRQAVSELKQGAVSGSLPSLEEIEKVAKKTIPEDLYTDHSGFPTVEDANEPKRRILIKGIYIGLKWQ
jgi:hypothetical protein